MVRSHGANTIFHWLPHFFAVSPTPNKKRKKCYPSFVKLCEQIPAPKMAAMMIVTVSLPTTTTTSSIAPFPLSPSYSTFSNLTTGSRTSTHYEYMDRFSLRSTPTDGNRVLSSNLPPPPSAASSSLDSASDVVRRFYEGINSRDLSTVVDLIAEDCVYEDLVFPQPFIGRKVNSYLNHKFYSF